MSDMTPTPCHCPFHDTDCLVPAWQAEYWPDYATLDECIADDDLTTLMLNRAVETDHPFIDHLVSLAEEANRGRCFYPLVELTPEELERYLGGDKSLVPDECTTICMTGATQEQWTRWFGLAWVGDDDA